MKYWTLFGLLFALLIIPPACSTTIDHRDDGSQNDSIPEMRKLSGNELVLLVLADSYYDRLMPLIDAEDIEIILEQADDTSLLFNFPINPLSSFIPEAVRKGEFLLWVVEAWRTKYPPENTFSAYPSSVPLFRPNDSRLCPYNSGEKLLTAVEAYRNWWKQYGHKHESAKAINPLENSGISW